MVEYTKAEVEDLVLKFNVQQAHALYNVGYISREEALHGMDEEALRLFEAFELGKEEYIKMWE